jgi:hypothetical protein
MNCKTFRRVCLGGIALSALIASGCSMDEADDVADTWMQGTMFGTAFEAGPGAVTVEADGSAVIRIFEASEVQDACAADPTEGHRIEILMAKFQTGRYEAANNEGWVVEAWNGREGMRDPYSLIEIDLVQPQTGGDVVGRARFGSAQSGDLVEGRFKAVVCSIATE